MLQMCVFLPFSLLAVKILSHMHIFLKNKMLKLKKKKMLKLKQNSFNSQLLFSFSCLEETVMSLYLVCFTWGLLGQLRSHW